MFYCTDIDENGKVNKIITLPSEEYITLLGWDRAEKEQTGLFVLNLPEVLPGYDDAQLHVNSNNELYYTYSGYPLANAKAAKNKELNAACDAEIENGVDYNGEHYALTLKDQFNIQNRALEIAGGATQVKYHADGKACRNFTAAEFGELKTAAELFTEKTTTHCNFLHQYVLSLGTVAEVEAVTYQTALPADLQAAFDELYPEANNDSN